MEHGNLSECINIFNYGNMSRSNVASSASSCSSSVVTTSLWPASRPASRCSQPPAVGGGGGGASEASPGSLHAQTEATWSKTWFYVDRPPGILIRLRLDDSPLPHPAEYYGYRHAFSVYFILQIKYPNKKHFLVVILASYWT